MVTYTNLKDLARSRYIKVIETSSLKGRSGMRFRSSGNDTIAVNAQMPMSEKIRALGFLLENHGGEGVASLRCPR